jgi:hypothetical protein
MSVSTTQPTARNNDEAQKLYNHVRTTAILLDSLSRAIPSPFLQDIPPALDIGLEAIIGLVFPVIGDVFGFFLGVYLIFCCWLFGDLGWWTLGQMVSFLFECPTVH